MAKLEEYLQLLAGKHWVVLVFSNWCLPISWYHVLIEEKRKGVTRGEIRSPKQREEEEGEGREERGREEERKD